MGSLPSVAPPPSPPPPPLSSRRPWDRCEQTEVTQMKLMRTSGGLSTYSSPRLGCRGPPVHSDPPPCLRETGLFLAHSRKCSTVTKHSQMTVAIVLRFQRRRWLAAKLAAARHRGGWVVGDGMETHFSSPRFCSESTPAPIGIDSL